MKDMIERCLGTREKIENVFSKEEGPSCPSFL